MTRFLLLLPLSLAALSVRVEAASANDTYASREDLPVGLVSTASNVGGTLEVSEPVPDGVKAADYQDTLWWRFTPNFTGWYEINTVGSDGDTVLAVWTGGVDADFSSAPTLVQVNDEAAEGKVSRIWLYAQNTTTYKISVGAKGTVRGNVKLRAFMVPDPFAKVDAVSFDSASVDVSNAPAEVSATLGISASREITGGSFSLWSPDGLLVLQVSLGVAQRTAGNVVSGTYAINFTVPRYVKPGIYAWSASLDNTVQHRHVTFGREGLVASPSGTLNVQNSGAVDTYGLWLAQADATFSGRGALGGGVNLGDVLGPKRGPKSAENLRDFAFGADSANGGVREFSLKGNKLEHPGLPHADMFRSGDGKHRLRMQFVRRMNDDAVSYKVQFSNDLQTWTDATNSPVSIGSDGTFEALEVQDTQATNDTPSRFSRVKIEYLLP